VNRRSRAYGVILGMFVALSGACSAGPSRGTDALPLEPEGESAANEQETCSTEQCATGPDGTNQCVGACVTNLDDGTQYCGDDDSASRLTPDAVYTNACFRACGAACSQCALSATTQTYRCETSPACSWHDGCYMSNWNKACGTRICDLLCVYNFGLKACLSGLVGLGKTAMCFSNPPVPANPPGANVVPCPGP
jgi:hypothetical protein